MTRRLRCQDRGARAGPSQRTDAGDRRSRGRRGASAHRASGSSRRRPDAPRSRRPTDGVLLALAVLGASLLSFPAPGPTASTRRHEPRGPAAGSRRVVLGGRLRPADHLVAVPAAAGVLRATGGNACSSTRCSRSGSALGFAILVGNAERHRHVDEPRRASSTRRRPPIYLATRIAIATAVIVTASPDLARPMRLVGRWLIAIGAVAARRARRRAPDRGRRGVPDRVRLGRAGTPALRLTRAGGSRSIRSRRCSQELGVDATATRDAPLQPRGVALTLASTSGGQPAPRQGLRSRRLRTASSSPPRGTRSGTRARSGSAPAGSNRSSTRRSSRWRPSGAASP